MPQYFLPCFPSRMFPQEARTPPLHSRQQPRSKYPCSFGPCGVPKGKRGLTRGAYFLLHAHHTSSFLLWHTSSFVRAVALPLFFVTPLPSFSTYLFHLPLPSASSTDVKELPTSLHHCRFICLFHLPLPPTSKSFQRRFTTVASSLSLHHCRFFTVTMSRSYLGKCNRHQKHHITFLEPNSGRAES